MAMIEVTFSADADLLDLAEQIAKEKGATLEEEIRQWLDDFGAGRWKLPPKDKKRGRRAYPLRIEVRAAYHPCRI